MIHESSILSQFNNQNIEEAMYVHNFNRGGCQSVQHGGRGGSFRGRNTSPGSYTFSGNYTRSGSGSRNYIPAGYSSIASNSTYSQDGHSRTSRGGQQTNQGATHFDPSKFGNIQNP
jgi:hypothetical protein